MKHFYPRRWLLLLMMALVGSGCTTLSPVPRGEAAYRHVEYARPAGKRLHLDLFVPRTGARRLPPLVVWFHGGGRVAGDKGMQLFVRDLTREGYAVASVNYRLTFSAKYPAQIEDCRAAVAWLRAHGREYGYDPQRVYLSGASAGAHLAALLALERPRPYVRGVFVMYTPTDLNGFKNQDDRFGFLPWLFGGPVTEKRSQAIAASPVTYVYRGAPPFLMMHGAKDKLVPLRQSEVLHEKLRAAGVSSRLIVLPEKKHGFSLRPEQVRQVAHFFDTHP